MIRLGTCFLITGRYFRVIYPGVRYIQSSTHHRRFKRSHPVVVLSSRRDV